MTTVREHFKVQVACWRDKGGCATFHAVHVHVDFAPHASGDPKCDGGTAGWSAPGSPNLQAFLPVVHARFPTLKLEEFNCRKIDGSTSWSQHSYWNAVDIMTPTVPIGQEVWDWLNGPYTPPEVDMTFEEWEAEFYKRMNIENDAGMKSILDSAKGMRDGLGNKTLPNQTPTYATSNEGGKKVRNLP